MVKQAELAVVTVNGRKFDDWDSVKVETAAVGEAKYQTGIAQLSVTEKIGGNRSFATVQIKPGDKATVSLAGRQIINGVVTQRQAAYDARSHGVIVVIRSVVADLVDSSAPLKNSQFKDKTLKEIVEKLIEPFGIKLKVVNESKSFDRKFKDVNIVPGESVMSVVDRLSRMRGMQAHDDENGNLVIASGTDGRGGDLVEGKNILQANCLISDESMFSPIGVYGQQRGDDKTDDETARKPAGKVDGNSDRHRPLNIIVEQPGDAQDLATRAEDEQATLLGKTICARVVVQGWLQASGDLWKLRQVVSVVSPMLMLYGGQPLGIQSIVFSQDNQSGTTTMLELVRPEAMGAIGGSPTGTFGGPTGSGEVEV